ncbi:MAG: hypothetical protein JNK69_03720 [Saprospiraceae bacterium]|jgi:hypothetical protein|nr:hypothetical protein [Candidatus Vicinibacter proximus]MBL7822494.1 hypothetical protein [Saprospiraceae bacterium]MCC6844305.1 hypothetical protein [Saprospiraceae bacterium]HRG34313.1 hypothetical protein [Saprospiraceae bacterium]
MKLSGLVLIAGLMLTYSSCSDDTGSSNDCAGVVATYSTTVKSVLDASCALAGCHSGTTPANGFNFSNYTGAKAVATSSGEKLICAINQNSNCSPMPKGGNKLDVNTIKLITCWVDAGAPQ